MTHVVGKSSRVHDAIGDLIKYTKENHSFLNLWCYLLRLFNRHFFGRVVNQSLTDYRRIFFLTFIPTSEEKLQRRPVPTMHGTSLTPPTSTTNYKGGRSLHNPIL